ncbi:MAG: glycoside hydrolase family 13 protein [Burkholderiaceae bacterium]|nr:glycoside hydrolase family 13 protein [Roseateles sp.]MBV8470848.1 glycoside hydrolase family 13 protein [Burkholderiaceae bacterium]
MKLSILNPLAHRLAAAAAGALMLISPTMAQTLERIEPHSWWVGMHNPELQLMLHGENIAELEPRIDRAGVTLLRSTRTGNPNYLFIDLRIDPSAQPGEMTLELQREGHTVLRSAYALQARTAGSAERRGFGPADAIYLVVPDRFAQGNPPPRDPAMLEGEDRQHSTGRHGGNLDGLRRHLDYIAGLGFTMLWPTPLTENNNPAYSYHGYAATDFYRVDPRFGSNEDYRALVAEAHTKGLGVIQDVVLNHIGLNHWWMRDLPSPDWIHQWAQFTETSHARLTVQDPYAAEADRRVFSDGWFGPHMPDLNQRNPLLATYLIQNSLWWIEYAGLSGLRIDTYSYSDKDFLAIWSQRVMAEYPHLNLVGEEWSPHPTVVAYWLRGKANTDGYRSSMPSMMDFPLHGALLAALTENDSHSSGLSKLYEALAQDFVYPDPANLVVFEGNHDTPRLYSTLHDDTALTRMALAYLAVTRRIPQITYGTELLMQSPRERDDGAVRADFPGGWRGDSADAFKGAGLSAQQHEMQDFVRRLFNWRKRASAVHSGALTHYSPSHGIYVLCRRDDKQRVMLLLNKSKETQHLDLARFAEMLHPGETAHDVLGARGRFELGAKLDLAPRSVTLLELEGAAAR